MRLMSACSANDGAHGFGGSSAVPSGAGGTAANTGGSIALPPGAGALSSSGGAPILIVPTTGGTGQGGASDGCPAIRQKPEQVVTYKPVALFIMQDRTGSMVTGFPSGCACSWQNSTDALTAFMKDPASAGLDVGLGYFGGLDKSTCDGSDCGQDVVPIQPIAMSGPAIVTAMNTNTNFPNPLSITPLECGLHGMIDACSAYMSQSTTGERCVAVLVTDGNTMDPTNCDPNVANLVQIVADGHSKGVNTYTLGLQGSDPNFLDQIAQAGGTMAHIDASAGVQAFVSALNSIRQSITIKMALPCTWKIPPAPAETTFDPTKVNVQYIPPGGAPQSFGHVNSEADCAQAVGDAWYYDNGTDPAKATQVIACPNTCNSTLHDSLGEVDVAFGCDTVPATIR
jgi:hypothetical protein